MTGFGQRLTILIHFQVTPMHHLNGRQDFFASVAPRFRVSCAVWIDYVDHVSRVVVWISIISYLDAKLFAAEPAIKHTDYLAYFREFSAALDCLYDFLVHHGLALSLVKW